MTLLVTPGPEFLDTQDYPAQRFRYLLEHTHLQEGVFDATDYKVVQRGAGANMSVDVGAGAAWIKGETGTRQGFYHLVNDATMNIAVSAAHGTLPRVDQVVLRVFDSTVAGGSDVPTLSVLAGTATSGAQITNTSGANYRAGAATLPNEAIRLADFLVAAADTSITNSEIVDRRPWVRGAYHRIVRNSNAGGGSDYQEGAGTVGVMDATNLQPRIECSGVPLRVTLTGMGSNSGAASGVYFELRQDDGHLDNGQHFRLLTHGSTANAGFSFSWDLVPIAGSHIFAPWFASVVGATTAFVRAQATIPLEMVVEEIVRQNVANS